MHPYIPHLLADIIAAHRSDIPGERFLETIEEELEEIEKWVSREEPEDTFGYYCGLKSEDFPPPEQLTNKEMLLIRKAFEKMMFTWNHGIDLPNKLPVAFAYKMIVDSLNMKTTIVNSGQIHFDFCSGDPTGCVFKEYCPCRKYWNNPIKVDMSGKDYEEMQRKNNEPQNSDDLKGDYDGEILY